uniref:Fibronectin type-III domain-containing protein n=1 Tax=Astyanax mexicanus TaxID=7994 RepID=A0A8B9L7V6_ASTMX
MYSGRPQACYELLRQVRPGRAHVSLFNTQPSCDFTDLFIWSGRVCVACSSVKGAQSDTVAFTTLPGAPDAPAAPRLLQRTKSSISLQWRSPNDNGSKITGFCLEYHEGKQSAFKEVYSGLAKQYKVMQLMPSTKYAFRLAAKNDVGMSAFSSVVSCCTASCSAAPPAPPAPPRLTEAGVTWLSLEWSAPCGSAGRDTLVYILEVEEKGLVSGEGSHNRIMDVPCKFQKLFQATTYVAIFNALYNTTAVYVSLQWGPLSEKCQASTAAGPPEQCRAPELTLKTSSSVLASWQVPVCNGAEVCEFRMEWGLEEGSLELLYCGPSSQYEVNDLRPATEYRCRVQAVSDVGAGLFSDVAMVTTPASVPAAVEHVEEMRAEPLDDVMPRSSATTLALRWKEPRCHGAEISSYNIDIGEELPLSVGRTSYHILENLQPETTYRIRVQAVNSIGSGPFSSVLKLRTRGLPPEPPLLECAVAGPQSLKLKWGEGPSRPQNSRGTHYCLHMQVDTDRSVCIYSGPCHTFKVQRLCEATEYQFSIQAHSEAGMGPLSTPYTFSTTRSPPPQLRAPKVEPVEWNKYAVTWETLQPMRGDPIVYNLQLLRGREVEQLYKGPATSYTWQNSTTGVSCRLRVCAGRRSQEGSELWGQCSLSTSLPATAQPREHKISSCQDPLPKRSWPLTDEPFATILLFGFVVLAVLFAVLIQYFVIERQ